MATEMERYRKKALAYTEENARLIADKRAAEDDLMRAKSIIRKLRAKVKRLKQEQNKSETALTFPKQQK